MDLRGDWLLPAGLAAIQLVVWPGVPQWRGSPVDALSTLATAGMIALLSVAAHRPGRIAAWAPLVYAGWVLEAGSTRRG